MGYIALGDGAVSAAVMDYPVSVSHERRTVLWKSYILHRFLPLLCAAGSAHQSLVSVWFFSCVRSIADPYKNILVAVVIVIIIVIVVIKVIFMPVNFFLNPILFAICTSTFSKLCKNMYTVACRRVLSSAPL
jgi:hypothetical protein